MKARRGDSIVEISKDDIEIWKRRGYAILEDEEEKVTPVEAQKVGKKKEE